MFQHVIALAGHMGTGPLKDMAIHRPGRHMKEGGPMNDCVDAIPVLAH